MRRTTIRHRGLIALVALAAFATSSPAAAAAKDEFETFLLGPWGKSTTSGEPVADMIPSSFANPRFTRKACPPGGLAGPADMLSNETWFVRDGGGAFRRHFSPTSVSPLTFRRLEGPDVAHFEYYNTFLATNVTMKIERISKDRMKTTVAIPGTVVETYYVRCRQR